MKSPKSKNLETFKLLIFDIYLHCQKIGDINGSELTEKFSSYKVDNHYTKKALIGLGIIHKLDKVPGDGKAHIFGWAAGVPTEELVQQFFSEVYMIRHIDQEAVRNRRKEERRVRKAFKEDQQLVEASTDVPVEVPAEVQVESSEDAWCLKFPDEKQYFSAFGLEVMRKIGRLFCIESVK